MYEVIICKCIYPNSDNLKRRINLPRLVDSLLLFDSSKSSEITVERICNYILNSIHFQKKMNFLAYSMQTANLKFI